MTGWRLWWGALVGCALIASIVTALEPAGSFSLGCSKTGDLTDANLAHADATCESSTLYAFGAWPLIQIALVLGVPAIVAGAVARRAVSVLAVIAYVAAIGYGITHWASWPVVLVPGGALLAVLALILAILQPTPDVPSDNNRGDVSKRASHDRGVDEPPSGGGMRDGVPR